jgi:hypothetical protein
MLVRTRGNEGGRLEDGHHGRALHPRCIAASGADGINSPNHVVVTSSAAVVLLCQLIKLAGVLTM